MVAIFGGFTAKFSGGVILLLPRKTKAPPTVAPIDGDGSVLGQVLKRGSAYAASLRILPKWLSSV
jgi:hypothetical protein